LATPTSLGIQVEEECGPDQTIARLGTARTAFVGRTLRGPVHRPTLLTSFAEFQHVYGGLWQPSPLGYAVEHFFGNGGREAMVVRVVNGARAATLTLPAGPGRLRLQAVRPGTREFLRASVDYDNVAQASIADFNLTVQRVRMLGTEQVDEQEIFSRVSIVKGAERFIGDVLADSQLIRLLGDPPAARPDRTLDSASGLATRYVNSNADGDDGAPLTDYDVIGSKTNRSGMFALDTVDYFNLLCIPPLAREQDVGPGTLLVATRYCKERRALLIADPPSTWHTADDALRGMREWNFSSENALMYFPHILAYDKLRGHFEAFAPCGAVAGMLARSDDAAPAWGGPKTEDAILRPGFRPACMVVEDRRARLAAVGINVLQSVRQAARKGVSLRTLAAGTAGTADWQNLAMRRRALFILNCVERGTRWVVLGKTRAETAELTGTQVRAFFDDLYAEGGFGDLTREDAFFVICGDRVKSGASASSREFQFVIGFASSRQGEFHSFRIVHSPAGSAVTPVSLNRLHSADLQPEELEWVDTLARQLLAEGGTARH
jgi:uncharacterized protein